MVGEKHVNVSQFNFLKKGKLELVYLTLTWEVNDTFGNWYIYLWPEKLMVLLVLFYLYSVIYARFSLCDHDRKKPHILQFGTNISPPFQSHSVIPKLKKMLNQVFRVVSYIK